MMQGSCRRLQPPPLCRGIWKMFGHKKEVDLRLYENEVVVAETLPPTLMGRPRLTELSLKGIARYMMTAQCQNILVMSGPQISAAAGIADYREYGGMGARKLIGDQGYVEKMEAKGLFDLHEFSLHPYAILRFCQALWPGNHRPTLAHYFIKTLQEKGLLLRNWTENIDNLERLAGIRSDKLAEAHGSFLKWKCSANNCGQIFDLLWLKERMESHQFPNCSKCFSKCAPDITFYESECRSLFHQAEVDAANCDLLIVLGSELLETPFCDIPLHVPWDVPRLVVSIKDDIDRDGDIMDIHENFDFDSDEAYRDVFWQGSTDLAVLSLCSYLDWDKDVRYMMDSDTAVLKGRKEMQQRLGVYKDYSKEVLPKLR